MCGYGVVAAPLAHGPWVALLAGWIVSIGVVHFLALVLERRWLRSSDMALAFTIGDHLLVVALGLGIGLAGTDQPCGLTGPAGQYIVAGGWLVFGLWQWRAEVRAKFYSAAQALSPTKIWHQTVVYPLLGSWLTVAVANGLGKISQKPVAVTVMVVLVGIWAGLCLHDQRKPRLGHPPYDWKRLRPAPRPWPTQSRTLTASAARET